MLRVTNTVANLQGEDRDVVALRNKIKQEANKHIIHTLPSAEDLDKDAEEKKIAEETR